MTAAIPAVLNSESHLSRECSICQNRAGNEVYCAREMLLGLREVFRYMECHGCGCVQLIDPPDDLTRYYPCGYTAFVSETAPQNGTLGRIRRHLRRRRNQGFFPRRGFLNRFLAFHYDYLPLKAFGQLGVESKARILDVGCGSGRLLFDLRELGYTHLLGVDRFIPRPFDDGTGLRIIKGTLEDIIGSSWDIIMFHHSFEHMSEPLKVLQRVAALLAAGGHCLIRIPVIGWAWENYRVHWAQLDAPRHFFLHSEKSFGLIAKGAGLTVSGVDYDSDEFQFWASELYARDIPLASLTNFAPETVFSKSELKKFRSRAAHLNSTGRGDSAVFKVIKTQ